MHKSPIFVVLHAPRDLCVENYMNYEQLYLRVSKKDNHLEQKAVTL